MTINDIDNSLSLTPSLELSLLGLAVEDSESYGLYGLPAPTRPFGSLALFFWGSLALLVGMLMLAQGISLSQRDHALSNLADVFSNGTELYFLVFLLFLYSLLQLLCIFRLYGIVFVEFVSILGLICCFFCGAMAWFSLQVPRAAWAELDKSSPMCVDFSVYCTGIHLMFTGSILSIVGILLLQPHQLFLLHLDQPISPFNLKSTKTLEPLSEVEIAASELEGAGIEDASASQTEQQRLEEERIGRFWISSLTTFKFLHGGLVVAEVAVFLLFLVGIVLHVQMERNIEYNTNGAINLCVLVVFIILGVLFSVLLLLEHPFKLYNYLAVYVLNILNISGLGLAFFLSGGCSLIFSSSTTLCQSSILMLFSSILLLIFFIMDEALLLVSVAFGAIDAKLRDGTSGELSSLSSFFESFVDIGKKTDEEGFEMFELEESDGGSLPPIESIKSFKAYSNL